MLGACTRNPAPPAVDQFFEISHDHYADRGQTGRAAEVRQIFRKYVLKELGHLELNPLDQAILDTLVQDIAQTVGLATAFKVRAALIRFLGWCVDGGALPTSPAVLLAPVKTNAERSRSRSGELRAIWHACDFFEDCA